MSTFLIAAASFVGFIIAYNTYGRWLANRIFELLVQRQANAPAMGARNDLPRAEGVDQIGSRPAKDPDLGMRGEPTHGHSGSQCQELRNRGKP